MIQESCLICGGETSAQHANIVPFLIERCGFDTGATKSRYCAECAFVFFERRLTASEARRLYANYRKDEYNQMRVRVEPSYAPFIPIFDDPSSGYYQARVDDYLRALSFYPEFYLVRRVLDFGGDGSLPKKLFPGAIVEYDDLSVGKTARDGPYDLIFASQVFEHLSAPRDELARIYDLMDENGVLFIDIPIEYQGPIAKAWHQHAQLGGSLVNMHEHINHFSAQSVVNLLRCIELLPFFQMVTRSPKLGITLAARKGSRFITDSGKATGLSTSSVLGRLW